MEPEDKSDEQKPSKLAIRSSHQTVNSAREISGRRLAHFAAKPYIEKDDD